MTLAESDNPTLTQSLLYLDGVSVSFDGYKALRSLSLMLQPGEMRAIIGPNGAGKTTMMDVITGKTRPQTGKVFFGQTMDLTRMREAEIAQAGIGRKFQKPTVFEQHSVFDTLELAIKTNRGILHSLFGKLTGEQLDRIDEILETVQCRNWPTCAPACCRTARNNGWRSACCWRRSPSCCCSTSRWPA